MRCCGRPLVFRRSKENSTSAEVIGAPSEKCARGSRWKVTCSRVGVEVDRARDQAVKREGLVLRARHQRLEDIADKPLRGRTRLDVERIEAVEGRRRGRRAGDRPSWRRGRRRGSDRNRGAGAARHAWRRRAWADARLRPSRRVRRARRSPRQHQSASASRRAQPRDNGAARRPNRGANHFSHQVEPYANARAHKAGAPARDANFRVFQASPKARL